MSFFVIISIDDYVLTKYNLYVCVWWWWWWWGVCVWVCVCVWGGGGGGRYIYKKKYLAGAVIIHFAKIPSFLLFY